MVLHVVANDVLSAKGEIESKVGLVVTELQGKLRESEQSMQSFSEAGKKLLEQMGGFQRTLLQSVWLSSTDLQPRQERRESLFGSSTNMTKTQLNMGARKNLFQSCRVQQFSASTESSCTLCCLLQQPSELDCGGRQIGRAQR